MLCYSIFTPKFLSPGVINSVIIYPVFCCEAYKRRPNYNEHELRHAHLSQCKLSVLRAETGFKIEGRTSKSDALRCVCVCVCVCDL
jgi:hypothetical protein